MTDHVLNCVVDETAMQDLGARIRAALSCPAVVFLRGELGAGKTTLVRAILRAFDYTGNVKSPTFSLLETYQLDGLTVHHLDLYRLASAEELEYIGFHDLLNDDLIFIEWPERAMHALPDPDVEIDLSYHDLGRRISVTFN